MLLVEHDHVIEAPLRIDTITRSTWPFTLLLSRYAQAYYLGDEMKGSLTKTVESWREYLPDQLPLPHPSPRNNIWLKKNPWFVKEVIPYLRRRVGRLLR